METVMADTVNTHSAKTNLSKLLAKVEKGEEIIIARHGKPIARLVPMPKKKKIVWGKHRGMYKVPEDFDDPIPELIPYYT